MIAVQESGLLVDRVERQLQARLAGMAAAGESALPKELDLARDYGVSLKTIRGALSDLKRKGVLRSVPGKGSFVVPEHARQRLTLVLCRDITHPYAAVATQTVLKLMRERGLPATLSIVEEGRSDWSRLGFSPRDVGGILAFGAGLDPVWLASLRRDGVPVAVLGDFISRTRQHATVHQVTPDNRAASYLATRHLLQAGHRHVLHACWGGANISWGRELARGYREALEEAGIPFNPAHQLSPPVVRFDLPGNLIQPLGSLQEELDHVLSGPEAPTAVVHNASLQRQAQEMLHSYFHDRFDPAGAVVALSHTEVLESGFRDGATMWSVAMPFRDVAELALRLLTDRGTDAAPMQATVNTYRLWRRDEGRWRPTETMHQTDGNTIGSGSGEPHV